MSRLSSCEHDNDGVLKTLVVSSTRPTDRNRAAAYSTGGRREVSNRFIGALKHTIITQVGVFQTRPKSNKPSYRTTISY